MKAASSTIGRWNIGVGLWIMAGFMIYGFVLIYLRDFAPDAETWIAEYNISPHFEARLAHVHGNLFSLLNIVFGLVLLRVAIPAVQARRISILALAGLLMPFGILSEIYLGLPAVFVIIGGVSILTATILLAWAVMHTTATPTPPEEPIEAS